MQEVDVIIPAISFIFHTTVQKGARIMNISEAELLTGITKQNIRFYEKKDCSLQNAIRKTAIGNIPRKT